MTDNKNILIDKIKNHLIKIDEIEFAYLFGSRTSNKIRFKSDIDIAVFFNKEIELLKIGKIINELEDVLKLEVDLVLLNDLNKKNPELAFNIINEGVLIFSNNKNLLSAFKYSIFLEYLDVKPMLSYHHEKFLQRLHNNNFAASKSRPVNDK